MKKLLVLLCLIISLQGFSQAVTRVGNVFTPVQDEYVGQYVHENQTDSVYMTKNGKFWYWKTSKAGKRYKAYLRWVK